MQKKKGRKMRLPNGFGSIVTLKGNRRNPYAAYTKTRGYDDNGNPIRDILGYYETWEDAYACLLDYNKSPYDIDVHNITFKELTDRFIQKKAKKLVDSTIKTYKSFLKAFDDLNDKKVAVIKSYHLEPLFDSLCDEYKYSSLDTISKIASGVFKLAMEYDIIDKNPMQFVDINKDDDTVSGIAFTNDELRKLWACVDTVPGADMILVMCYSGYRVLAYKNLKVDIENMLFLGGVKTKKSKDRYVPIHHKIKPLVERLQAEKRLFGQKPYTIRRAIPEILEACNIDPGTFPYNHTPHDCRHTFITLLHEAKVDEIVSNTLSGHVNKTISAEVYTHITIDELRDAIESIEI